MRQDIKLFQRILILIIAANILSTLFSISSFALSDAIRLDISLTSDGHAFTSDQTSRYVDDEVIIMIAESTETKNVQFYSLYSDDRASINESVQANLITNDSAFVTETGTIDMIDTELNLGVNFSEMKLLNPSKKSDNGLYSLNDTSNSIFSLKFDNVSVTEVLKILNENSTIKYAEPNYLYSVDAVPNDP